MRKNRIGILAVLVNTMVFLASCSYEKLPLRTTIEPSHLRPAPLSVALVMPDDLRTTVTRHDVSCAGHYEVPLGAELETAMVQALSQIFQTVEVVPSREEALQSDVMTEVTTSQLTAEGHCVSRRLLYLFGPFYLFFNPTDSFEGQASLSVKVTAANGQVLLNDTLTSPLRTRHNMLANDSSRASALEGALRDALTDSIQQLRKRLVSSNEYHTYAAKVLKRRTDRPLARLPRATAPSEVDIFVQNLSSTDQRKKAAALIIGVEQYRQGLQSADFAAHDAEVMKEYITKGLGFPEGNVALLIDEQASRSDLEKYIEHWLPNHSDKDTSVLVYYSGHGAPNPTTGEGFLIPYDGDPSFLEVTGYPLKRLYDQLGKLSAKEILVVLDSCFSGSGGRSVIAKGARPMVLTVDNPVLVSEKMAVLTASSGAQISSTYHDKGHGLLTYFLLKGLQGAVDGNTDGSVKLTALHAYIQGEVQGIARREFNNDQTPQLIGTPKAVSRQIQLPGKGKKK
jgi:hypothetical protein